MSNFSRWQYDEMCQTGVDYSAEKTVAGYDGNHLRIYELKIEAEGIIAALRLERAGFTIDRWETPENGFGAQSLCTKAI